MNILFFGIAILLINPIAATTVQRHEQIALYAAPDPSREPTVKQRTGIILQNLKAVVGELDKYLEVFKDEEPTDEDFIKAQEMIDKKMQERKIREMASYSRFGDNRWVFEGRPALKVVANLLHVLNEDELNTSEKAAFLQLLRQHLAEDND